MGPLRPDVLHEILWGVKQTPESVMYLFCLDGLEAGCGLRAENFVERTAMTTPEITVGQHDRVEIIPINTVEIV